MISIHSPYTGRDGWHWPQPLALYLFQSTLPIQGETKDAFAIKSIMAFQSTLPIQGETKVTDLHIFLENISIHSPYTGRDTARTPILPAGRYFNPLSLYRERPIPSALDNWDVIFQSTLPIQGETVMQPVSFFIYLISIHSPYTGRDPAASCFFPRSRDFNPLSLYRERHRQRL